MILRGLKSRSLIARGYGKLSSQVVSAYHEIHRFVLKIATRIHLNLNA